MTPIRRAVILVRTANRPEILNRCLAASVDRCQIALAAHWIVLDDSSLDSRAPTCEIARFWRKFGLHLTYIDKTVEEEIADSLPSATVRSFFARLAARSPFYRSEGGRNLGLVAGLSLNPDVLFFLDDDIVHHHERNCFFHWCADTLRPESFIASPRKRGISDMTYLNRLVSVLNRDDWDQFVSDFGISADPEMWYSPKNPLWKPTDDGNDGVSETLREKEVVSGQLMALFNRGVDWLPFPSEYNSDLNWSFLQSSIHGTPLLKVSGMNAHHLPPVVAHLKADAIVSELVGTAITRALRQIKPHGEQPLSRLADQFPTILSAELKHELFLFLAVEGAIRFRVRSVSASSTLTKIDSTLAQVAERLKSVDSHKLAGEWLHEIATRCKMFLELRRNEMVQIQIRRVLSAASV